MPSFGEASSSNSPLQQPLLSPALEVDAEAQEAKKNRKILDLEITNKSLLAINSGLEVVKLKHVREIRELKRKLREGRGLGSRMGVGVSDEEGDGILEEDEEGSEEEDSDDGEEGSLAVELEMAHARCKTLIDGMVNQARETILYKYEMDRDAKGGNRVLHPAEVEMMHGQTGDEAEDVDMAALSLASPLEFDEASKGDAVVEGSDE